MNTPQVHALIPAAGSSVRFGGATPKLYADLLGKCVLAHSIEAVSRHELVQSVTVGLAAGDTVFDELVRPAYPRVQTVGGGDSRAQTVINGLRFIKERHPDCDHVLIHDAARPCLTGEELNRLLEQGLADEQGAILAIPVHDTLKLASDSCRIERTVDRSNYWAAQTPQLFPVDTLISSLDLTLSAGEAPTDEAMAMERVGKHPGLVMGSSTNIKITTAADLALAEFILQRRSAGE